MKQRWQGPPLNCATTGTRCTHRDGEHRGWKDGARHILDDGERARKCGMVWNNYKFRARAPWCDGARDLQLQTHRTKHRALRDMS